MGRITQLDFEGICRRYIAWYKTQDKKVDSTWKEKERILLHYWVRFFDSLEGDMPIRIDQITEDQIKTHLRSEIAAGKKASVNRQHAVLRAMFSWLVGEGILSKNVAKFPKVYEEGEGRTRFLTMKEFKLVWKKIPSVRKSEAVQVAITMLAYTGARRSEVVKACWDNVDLDAGTWYIPEKDAKTKKPRTVFLAPSLVVLLEAWEAQDTSDGFGYLFKGRAIDGKEPTHMHANALNELSSSLRDALPKQEQWTIHDLRTSCGTHLMRLGCDRLTLKKILGHSTGGKADVTNRYDQYERSAERKVYMELWGEELAKYIAE